jgi:hypothetical protein
VALLVWFVMQIGAGVYSYIPQLQVRKLRNKELLGGNTNQWSNNGLQKVAHLQFCRPKLPLLDN